MKMYCPCLTGFSSIKPNAYHFLPAVSNNLFIIDYLLTECEVCTGKYLPEVFVQTERRRSEICAEKNRGQLLSRTDRTNEVNKEFIIWLLAPFFIAFNEALCS